RHPDVFNMFSDCQCVKHARDLRHVCKYSLCINGSCRKPLDTNTSLVAQKPGDALDNCRFPGSVWSEQNPDLPVRNSKIHIVHCYIISIRFAQSMYFQHKSSYSAGVSEYILHICIEKS